ncbi:mannosyl-oligosaccharide glucosidase [Brevipalpus obovatus]|uniref:mannosyl-oligosaccharide glucosidase n=1 Tax=Brevipalpus obovatus TaxID=246614 RepID=UPI003D9DD54D
MSGRVERRRKGKGSDNDQSSSSSAKDTKERSRKKTKYEKEEQVNSNFTTYGLVVVSISLLFVCLYFYPRDVDSSLTSKSGLRLPLRWGTFRSGHYFGIKKNVPSSVVAGLMWFKNTIEGNTVPIRHWCNQFDNLPSYSWTKHDFDTFGVQEIVDKNFTLTSSLLFLDHGWMSKISLRPNKSSSTGDVLEKPVSLIFYLARESDSDEIFLVSSRKSLQKIGSRIELGGTVSGGTKFSSFIQVLGKPKDAVIYVHDLSTHVEPPLVHLKEAVLTNIHLIRSRDPSPNAEPYIVFKDNRADKPSSPNFVAIQILTRKSLDVAFYLTEKPETTDGDSLINQFDAFISERSLHFDDQFNSVLSSLTSKYNQEQVNFAKATLSNMLGSIGYFHGYSLVRSDKTKEPIPYGPLELVTAVPSRSFFPRGFLWDEGFHNLLLSLFKPELSQIILSNWLNLMNSDGWIPREVILGSEALARVPTEFIVQDVTNGNPPTLLLSLDSMMERKLLNKTYLESIFPKLDSWFGWFNRTQTGPRQGTYRWHGRNPNVLNELNPKTLMSGLDDYPRASHPTDDEIHLDLRCWMAFASRIMHKIASFIGHSSAPRYSISYDYLSDNALLDQLHWSEQNQMYCDFGLHSNNVKLVKKPETEIIERKVLEKPIYQCVPELGYVSLFPMMMEILEPTNPRLGKILSVLEDPELLWSSYGIRSLSKKSNYYRKYNTAVDPPYWRGPIWVPMNFLILRSLKHYSSVSGPYQERARTLHDKLRENVVNNIFESYKTSGYLWEQYDDMIGKGKGSHPFTGWTALIVVIMAEKY